MGILLGNYILNYICYAQHLYIPLYNDNDLQLYDISYLSHVYFPIFLDKYKKFLHFHMITAALLLIISKLKFLFKIN